MGEWVLPLRCWFCDVMGECGYYRSAVVFVCLGCGCGVMCGCGVDLGGAVAQRIRIVQPSSGVVYLDNAV